MNEINRVRMGIIMNGVTGRIGANQHLLRSIIPIIKQGGVRLDERTVIIPDPVLVGRSSVKLEKLSARSGIKKWTTSLESALAESAYSIYFDAQSTSRRAQALSEAIKAGKHVYCEKPVALSSSEALEVYDSAQKAGIIHGVVQDKLWLPGIRKLKLLSDSKFFGKILSVRGEFGYWVFDGETVASQRPSWNYRAEEGGGIIVDMFSHWRYVLDNLFGEVKAMSCMGATHIFKRRDERGNLYACSADDAAYATFELEGNIIAQFNSSWATRVRRDDLLTIQVDGTKGSAVATIRDCYIQPEVATPRAIWNPDVADTTNYYEGWMRVPDTEEYENAFKSQWELFLKAVAAKTPFKWDLLSGAKGVQLAEKGIESWKKRAWIEVPALDIRRAN